MDGSSFGWVSKGKQKGAILKTLRYDRPKIQAQIMRDCRNYSGGEKIARGTISTHMKAFTEKGLVYCLNPEDGTGKAYLLTEKGEECRQLLLKETEEKNK
ncbi:MAG: hypothetical protein ABIJ40_20915 [Bacteroidota bacterium]